MKYILLLTLFFLMPGGGETVINFDNQDAGKLPGQWIAPTGKWEVRQDGKNKVLAQMGKSKADVFNLAIWDQLQKNNIELSVRIRAREGEKAQGGGLIFRYMDKNDYYGAWYNPLDQKFRFYKVQKGEMKVIAEVKYDIPSDQWFTMKVRAVGNNFEFTLDDEKVLSKTDKTFNNPGKEGFCSLADSMTWFDDFTLGEPE